VFLSKTFLRAISLGLFTALSVTSLSRAVAEGNAPAGPLFIPASVFAPIKSSQVSDLSQRPIASASGVAPIAPPSQPATMPQTLSVPEPVVDCPLQHEVRNECSIDDTSDTDLFSGPKALNLWQTPLREYDRCKLWLWVHHIEKWKYPPLAEYASYLKEGLVEGIGRDLLFDDLGLAPVPPSSLLGNDGKPQMSCHSVDRSEALRLTERLQKLNLKVIPQDLLDDLVEHCLAFHISTAPWKQIHSGIVDLFVLPIADTNFLIVAAPSFLQDGGPDPLSAASTRLIFTTIGTCPVRSNPRDCAEEFLDETGTDVRYGFSAGLERKIKAAPFRADVDTLFSGGRITEPVDVQMKVTPAGEVRFYYQAREETKPKLVRLTVEHSVLSLETDEYVCDPETETGKVLYLRPLAFGKELADLFKRFEVYTPRDFPESPRLYQQGPESGCSNGGSYSEWAARTANAALHYAHHGELPDSLYRSIARQRQKWSLNGKGIPKTSDMLKFGVWRTTQTETPLLANDLKYEVQAMVFARHSGKQTGDEDLSTRTNMVGSIPATEVWYFHKPILAWSTARGNIKTRVILRHLDQKNELYSKAMHLLEPLTTTCIGADERRDRFLSAAYALFNGVPLQRGEEIVGKAFIAALYENVYGIKLKRMKDWVDVDFDAMTLPYEDFALRYSERMMNP
jgi:hypothetical protein